MLSVIHGSGIVSFMLVMLPDRLDALPCLKARVFLRELDESVFGGFACVRGVRLTVPTHPCGDKNVHCCVPVTA
ncbi:hypothetical protein HMPREF2975_07135 [Actinomyces sp. HMSC065F12]|nr:hypothetical protein HMPREF2975_07135 [Actinomyces sp. HMSC065F12]